jgi:2,3-diketo-5-methylthio-1-phosphopentane phosphatase
MTAVPRVFLLDVEGTIAPISLVSEQLFPYARVHFASFLQAHATDPAVQSDLAMLANENQAESDPDVPRMTASPGLVRRGGETWEDTDSTRFRSTALRYVNWLMDRDRKSTALKSLQGKIWKAGFEHGELKGTLFPDVPSALHRWAVQGRVAIYSSGSTSAQQLLFRFSTFGDLTNLISAYFDTRTGPKTASASYSAIAAAIEVGPSEICFFSDVIRELDPAREAGMQTRLVIREGNAPIEDTNGHAAIHSFDSLF